MKDFILTFRVPEIENPFAPKKKKPSHKISMPKTRRKTK